RRDGLRAGADCPDEIPHPTAGGHPRQGPQLIELLRNLRQLVRYRGLIQSLVARELKARYRGSVLGFFWSFFNPLLLLLVYTFVFKYVLVGQHPKEIEPYALFLFCGLLPWTWFSSSLVESANVLISGGNLIKKVMFPAEVLPIVTVLANLVHFCFGLPILAIFLIYFKRPLSIAALNLNPFTHLAISYQEILFYPGPFGHWQWLLALWVVSAGVFLGGYWIFDRLRDSFAEEV